MEITIKGTEKEIAALVVELQKQQLKCVLVSENIEMELTKIIKDEVLNSPLFP